MKMQISILLRGGLGNQLFQATAGLFFAKKFDANAILDDSAIVGHSDWTRRSWLRKFDIENLFNSNQIFWMNKSRVMLKSLNMLNSKESSFLTESQLDSMTRLQESVSVYDWFQTKQYAEALKPTLQQGIQKSKLLKSYELAEDLDAKSRVAGIHIRLGDFRKTKDGPLSASWYRRAIQRVINDYEITELHCYSDEIESAYKIVKPFSSKVKLTFPEEFRILNPQELLRSLTCYPIYISSNSTLSWWASFFNQNIQSKIYCNWNDKLRLEKWVYIE
jgi:hypothetical protein